MNILFNEGKMKEKILILEDDPAILNNLVELFEEEKYTVYPGLDGTVGVALLKRYKPDMILCDITMPHINGIEFFKIVKENMDTKHTPFIFLTAKTDLASIRSGLGLGADDYITKPFSSEELLKTIKMRLKRVNDYNTQYDALIKNISMYIPHELRTPLVAIMGYSQLILSDLEKMEKKEIKETVERILWSAHRLHSRIEKFIAYSDLDLAKGEIGSAENKTVSRIDNDFVSNILLRHYLLNERISSIRLKIEPADLNISIIQISRLFKELLENAAKYSEPDSEIKVTGERKASDYVLTIVDYGIGMDKKEIENIGAFRQFSREIHGQEGNGLGLAICRKIVELNNGTILIESEKNKSTAIKVIFPL